MTSLPNTFKSPVRTIGNVEEDAATNSTDAWSIVALLKGIYALFGTGIVVTGGATSAKQDTGNTALSSIDGHVDGLETLVGSTNTKLDTLHADLVAPLTTKLAAATNASTTAYATNLVIKNSAGTLYGLSGYNSKTSAQFIQLHDATSLPADTAAPKVVFTVAASSNFAIDFGARGRSFGTGIVICNSSTGATKTIGSADIWADAQYV